MQALLKRQTKALESLELIAKQDRLIQLVQTKEAIESQREEEKMDIQLVDMNKTMKKSLLDKTGDGLNSNVIKLFNEIKKVAAAGRELNKQEVNDITGASQERRQFNTVKPRVEKLKENVKDFFTVRGFLDKTGIVKRNSGGIISEYLDRAEDKKKYIDNRMKLDPTANLHGKDKAREIFAKQYDKQQNLQFDISQNEKKLKEYKDQGFTEAQIARTPEAKKQKHLATELAKVDSRVRPEGFDPKTGLVKEKEEAKPAIGAKSAKVIPFNPSQSSLGTEEAMLEQNRMVEEQSELLRKIEENTRGLSAQKPGEAKSVAQKEESSGGLLDMLGMGKLGGIAKSAGKGLGRAAMGAGKFLAQRAGPVAALAAVAGGAYTAYSGYGEANEKEAGALKDIDAKVASGEITEDQAKQLRTSAREEGTVNRSGAVGEGTGQAVGGAAGALKGAAVGAAIGSAVPIVGTVIGGAIGATVGAIGGSWLGGKGGKWLGEKFGKAKNWLFGKSGESETNAEVEKASSVDIQFSEATFAEKDPDNYAKFAKERDELTQKYATDRAKRVGREPTQMDLKIARLKAQTEIVQKYRKEIEAAGAGKVTGGKKEAPGTKTEESLKKTAEGVTGKSSSESWTEIAGERVYAGQDLSEKQMDVIGMSKSMGNKYSPEIENQYAKQLAKPRAAGTPSSGDTISKASGENETAKMEAQRGSPSANIVSAPTINNSQTVNNNAPKLPPRNTDNTVNRYLQKTYAF